MEEKGFLTEKPRTGAWKAVAAVTLVVAAVLVLVVAVTVPTVLCHRGGDGNSTERLEKALDVTNRSLSLSLGRWQRCKEELGEVQGKVSELEEALANVTRLEEQNRALVTEVTRLREQLGEEQNLRSQLEQQNRLIREELQDLRSARSSPGDKPALSPDVQKFLLILLVFLTM
ncbi:hypothetical protein HGM15179_017417 [Zosterops borbonicus]|uniref:Bone marrow stromal antigen 2 n=1 Tax=Zosterops borbonicus TaxID=364589 RepID=A0A8K1G0Z0_9PASS|nr:hypothetical protein HGM15179_017417 [Zosterops borbonicus]